jgi:hypothetical protein
MAYGHAERNLALIRQLEAEAIQLFGGLTQLDQDQSAWLDELDQEQSAWLDEADPSSRVAPCTGRLTCPRENAGHWVEHTPGGDHDPGGQQHAQDDASAA